MRVNGKHYRTVWMEGATVYMIDQTRLPFEFTVFRAGTWEECCVAIKTMITRGAGAIGATAGFAMAQAFLEADTKKDATIADQARTAIRATRPTARDLFFAVERVYAAGQSGAKEATAEARRLADANVGAARISLSGSA